MIKQTILFICLVVFAFLSTRAQEAVISAGGQASGSGGTSSFTVGQIVYTAIVTNEGSINQGVQQAYQISVLGGIENTTINLNISAYPNPTSDYLTLKVDNIEQGNYQYQLMDVSGTSLQQNNILEIESQLDLNSYKPGIYFCVVKSLDKVIKEFKIVKN